MSGLRVASGHQVLFYACDEGFENALEEARPLCVAPDFPGIAGTPIGESPGRFWYYSYRTVTECRPKEDIR